MNYDFRPILNNSLRSSDAIWLRLYVYIFWIFNIALPEHEESIKYEINDILLRRSEEEKNESASK